jgi:hypothetical protein
MRTVLRRLGIVTGVAVSAFAFSLTGVGQAVAQNVKPVLVQVINGSNNPVPVIGRVEVANTASAPVATRDLADLAARNAFSEQIRLDVTGGQRGRLRCGPRRLAASRRNLFSDAQKDVPRTSRCGAADRIVGAASPFDLPSDGDHAGGIAWRGARRHRRRARVLSSDSVYAGPGWISDQGLGTRR